MIMLLVFLITSILLGKLFVRQHVRKKDSFSNSILLILCFGFLIGTMVPFSEIVNTILSTNLGGNNEKIADIIFIIVYLLLGRSLYRLYKEEVKREEVLYELELKFEQTNKENMQENGQENNTESR